MNRKPPAKKRTAGRCPPALERDILRQCLDYLSLCPGIFAWRNNTGALNVGKRFVRFGTVGSSDILGVLPGGTGRILCVETKRRGQPVTSAQESFLARVRACGAVALVVHSVEELRAGLRAAGIEVP